MQTPNSNGTIRPWFNLPPASADYLLDCMNAQSDNGDLANALDEVLEDPPVVSEHTILEEQHTPMQVTPVQSFHPVCSGWFPAVADVPLVTDNILTLDVHQTLSPEQVFPEPELELSETTLIADVTDPQLQPIDRTNSSSPCLQESFKPVETLGDMCIAGFYLVSLTRHLIRNPSIPFGVRSAFLAPQLHFGFTVRTDLGQEWYNIPARKVPYQSLVQAGEWVACRLGVANDSFKTIKETLQNNVTKAWSGGRWHLLEECLAYQFDNVSHEDVVEALGCSAVCGNAKGTPYEYFIKINCHKDAADIRTDVNGALHALQTLTGVLERLELSGNGRDIPIVKFRKVVFPMWKNECEYVRRHSQKECCQFYDGGYFKKGMIHKYLYGIESCSSTYHVKDVLEGLNEVIKVWTNPSGMCVREVKCAIGLKNNVDKSFQSGIRNYSKAKFVEEAPQKAQELIRVEKEVHEWADTMIRYKMKLHPMCCRALMELEKEMGKIGQREMPDELQGRAEEGWMGGQTSSNGNTGRKRKRGGRESCGTLFTPREQKRKHALASLKRKEQVEKRICNFLGELTKECERKKAVLKKMETHGKSCGCGGDGAGMAGAEGGYVTSVNMPVA